MVGPHHPQFSAYAATLRRLNRVLGLNVYVTCRSQPVHLNVALRALLSNSLIGAVQCMHKTLPNWSNIEGYSE